MTQETFKHLNIRKMVVTLTILFLILLAVAIGSLYFGETSIRISEIFMGDDPSNANRNIFLFYRLPRLLLGIIVGASLSMVGVGFQALLRNPLADPYILGVSGGAAIGGTVAIAFNLDTAIGNSMVLAIAFAGALFATHIVFLLSRRQSRVDPYRLLLVGIVFNLFATSVIMFIKSIVSALKAQEILFWLLGSLAIERMDYTKLLYLAVFFIMGAIILIQMSPALNALSLGEAEANNLGYPVERVKTRIFIASSLIIGAVVSVSGLIGFVGLIIPHAMRLIIGPDHRLLMVASAFAGAAFLMFTDTVTRLLFRVFDTELPVGVLTAFIGGPIFVYLLQRSRKEKL